MDSRSESLTLGNVRDNVQPDRGGSRVGPRGQRWLAIRPMPVLHAGEQAPATTPASGAWISTPCSMSTADFRTARTATLWRGCSRTSGGPRPQASTSSTPRATPTAGASGSSCTMATSPNRPRHRDRLCVESALAQQAVLEARVKAFRSKAGEAGEAGEAT